MTDKLRISLLQTDIEWENKSANLCSLREHLEGLRGKTDIAILPEMFSTGFGMRPETLAEPWQGETVATLKQWAADYGIALAGSYIALDNILPARYANRAFFLTPQGDEHYYDKRHLFRMGGEDKHFQAGSARPIVRYKGWNILLLVCYDLRFPVWSPQCRQCIRPPDLRCQLACSPTPGMGHTATGPCAGKPELRMRRQPHRHRRLRHTSQRGQQGHLLPRESIGFRTRRTGRHCHNQLGLHRTTDVPQAFPRLDGCRHIYTGGLSRGGSTD